MKVIEPMRFAFFITLLFILLPSDSTSASSAHAGWFKPETPGDRFREGMKKRERFCAKRKRASNDISCEILELKPPDPYATPEGAFAHSLKLPGPPPKQVYRRGMTSEEYFKALCAAEAGEFIFKSVEVDGIFLMRPRQKATDAMFKHLYAMEDPYGYINGEADGPEFMFVTPTRYRFIEMPMHDSQTARHIVERFRHKSYVSIPPASARIQSYSDHDGRTLDNMVMKYKEVRTARYGFTWRGISRPHDRELGIAGGELIVLDLETQEVLGFRRGFTRTGNVRNHFTSIGWEFAAACPAYAGGVSKDHDFAFWFLSKVLVPRNTVKDHNFQRPLIRIGTSNDRTN